MTAFLGKKNNAESKIATVGGIDNSTNPVTFAVTTGEGSKFPASNFVITIDNEILLCTSRTGDNLTCTRAAEGTTIAAHTQNADVELRITAGTMEEYEKISNLQGMDYAADNQTSDAYEVTLAPAPTAYFTGMVVKFKANTLNTGACTLNVNSLGAKTLKKNYNSDLATGDILAGQIVTVIYDGTNFQVLSQLSVAKSFVRAYNNATITVPTASETKITFNAESFDTRSEFNTSDNSFTAKRAGYYLINVSVLYRESGPYRATLSMFLNGSYNKSTAGDITVEYSGMNFSDIIYLAANDVLTFYTLQSSGSNKTVHSDQGSVYMSIAEL